MCVAPPADIGGERAGPRELGTRSAERVATVRARVAASKRAARVDDVNAIENLQGSYGYYTDKMLWDEVVDLFADDGTLEIGPSGVYLGKDSIRRYLEPQRRQARAARRRALRPLPAAADHHRGGRWPTARAAGAVPDDRRLGLGVGGNWGEGVYENEYVKENGVWKIRTLHWYRKRSWRRTRAAG